MSFGLTGAPHSFQKAMNAVLALCSGSVYSFSLMIYLCIVLLMSNIYITCSRSFNCCSMIGRELSGLSAHLSKGRSLTLDMLSVPKGYLPILIKFSL
jgi:hypothetical protein